MPAFLKGNRRKNTKKDINNNVTEYKDNKNDSIHKPTPDDTAAINKIMKEYDERQQIISVADDVISKKILATGVINSPNGLEELRNQILKIQTDAQTKIDALDASNQIFKRPCDDIIDNINSYKKIRSPCHHIIINIKHHSTVNSEVPSPTTSGFASFPPVAEVVKSAMGVMEPVAEVVKSAVDPVAEVVKSAMGPVAEVVKSAVGPVAEVVKSAMESAVGAVAVNSFAINNNNYINNNNQIGTYTLRCFIISLKQVLYPLPPLERINDLLIKEYNNYINDPINNVIVTKLNDLTYDNNNRHPFGDTILTNIYIDAFDFFRWFDICRIHNTGIIITHNIVNDKLHFGAVGGESNAGQNHGLYIQAVDKKGELMELSSNTPIIYNIGNQHYVAGINPFNEQMLPFIKNSYVNYTSTMYKAPIKIKIHSDESCVNLSNVITNLPDTNFNAQVHKCLFHVGDPVLYNNTSYIVFERKIQDDVCYEYKLFLSSELDNYESKMTEFIQCKNPECRLNFYNNNNTYIISVSGEEIVNIRRS